MRCFSEYVQLVSLMVVVMVVGVGGEAGKYCIATNNPSAFHIFHNPRSRSGHRAPVCTAARLLRSVGR